MRGESAEALSPCRHSELSHSSGGRRAWLLPGASSDSHSCSRCCLRPAWRALCGAEAAPWILLRCLLQQTGKAEVDINRAHPAAKAGDAPHADCSTLFARPARLQDCADCTQCLRTQASWWTSTQPNSPQHAPCHQQALCMELGPLLDMTSKRSSVPAGFGGARMLHGDVLRKASKGKSEARGAEPTLPPSS